MSDHDSTTPASPTGLSRRTIVRTGAHLAWVTPAIVATSAAPAFAASGAGAFTINRGVSSYQVGGSDAYVFFLGLLLVADGPDIAPGTLQMSVTSSGDGASHTSDAGPGPQWTLLDPSPQSTFTWVYSDSVSGQSGAPNFSGAFIASIQRDGTRPTFTVQFSHPDYTTAVDVFT